MPDRVIEEAAGDLHAAVGDLHELLDRVEHRASRQRNWLIALGVFLLIGLVVAVVAVVAAVRANNALEAQQTANLRACQNRNSAQETARRDNLAILNGLREPFPGARDLIETLVAGQSTPVKVDTDCDGDGELTVNDYDSPTPTDLPLPLG